MQVLQEPDEKQPAHPESVKIFVISLQLLVARRDDSMVLLKRIGGILLRVGGIRLSVFSLSASSIMGIL